MSLILPPRTPELFIPILTCFAFITFCILYQLLTTAPPTFPQNYYHATYDPPPPPPPPPPDCKITNCLALTFDDGPSTHTHRLLDILERKNAKTTFFVLGSLAANYPDRVERAAAAGHDIAAHSWGHKYLTSLSPANLTADISATANIIQSITNQPVRYLRPPYGAVNQRVRDTASAHGQQIVLWDIDPQDWRYRDPATICEHIVAHARPNATILLHDIHATSVDAVECIIDSLSAQYRFVSLSTIYK